MPTRRDIFKNGEIYHVFNKTIDKRKVFDNEFISERFLSLAHYYRSTKVVLRYSKFTSLPDIEKVMKMKELGYQKYYKVNILCYSLMPNHFHFLLKQKKGEGLVNFVSDILNSTTRFFNVLYERQGPLFLPRFKSRRIVSREQLIHVSRYIHLNPYSSGLVFTLENLANYRLSSLGEYLKEKRGICHTDVILNQFHNNRDSYRNFVFNNAEHQKRLEACKYMEKWL